MQAQDCMIHSGFFRRFEDIALTEAYEHDLSCAFQTYATVVFTGHSLGGAVAALAALSCKMRYTTASMQCHAGYQQIV